MLQINHRNLKSPYKALLMAKETVDFELTVQPGVSTPLDKSVGERDAVNIKCKVANASPSGSLFWRWYAGGTLETEPRIISDLSEQYQVSTKSDNSELVEIFVEFHDANLFQVYITLLGHVLSRA